MGGTEFGGVDLGYVLEDNEVIIKFAEAPPVLPACPEVTRDPFTLLIV